MVDCPAMWLIKEGKAVTNGRFTRIPPASLGQHKYMCIYIYMYTYTCVTYIISISASMSISMFVLGVDTKHPFCPHFLTIPARSDIEFVAVLLRIGFLVPKAGFDCPSNEFVAETALGIHHSSPQKHHHSPLLMIHRFTRITQYEPSLTIINYR